MIITERQEADTQVDKIKDLLKQSSLNYFLEETPFRVRINLTKKLLMDFSPASKNIADPGANLTFDAKNVQITEEVKSEFTKAVLEVKAEKEKNEKKDKTIAQLEAKVKQMERQDDQFKKEISIKTEQLKHKNKLLEGTQKDLIKIKEEKESTIANLKSKINNYEQKNAKMQEELEKRKIEKRTDNKEYKKLTKDLEAKERCIKKFKEDLDSTKEELEGIKKMKSNEKETFKENKKENEENKNIIKKETTSLTIPSTDSSMPLLKAPTIQTSKPQTIMSPTRTESCISSAKLSSFPSYPKETTTSSTAESPKEQSKVNNDLLKDLEDIVSLAFDKVLNKKPASEEEETELFSDATKWAVAQKKNS